VKFAYLLISFALFTGQNSWAKKGKVEVVDHYDVPCIYESPGSINKDFFDDFKSIEHKSNSCTDGNYKVGDGDDPIWKARKYLTQMRKLATDMPLLIAINATDLSDANLKKLGIEAHKKIKKSSEGSTLDSVSKVMGVAGSVHPPAKAAKSVVDGLAFILKMDEKLDNRDKEIDLEVDMTTQLKGIEQERDKLVKELQQKRHRFDDILMAMDGNENAIKDLSFVNQEIMRATICKFTPAKDDGVFRYKQFCDSSKGGADFTSLRGTSSCKDVTAISDENMPTVKRTIKANFALHIATSVKVADRSGMFPDGHTARFEINVKSKPPIFAAPGGNKLLCKILKDPKYDGYWSKGSPKILSDSLSLIDVGMPVIYRNEMSNWTVGTGDFWYYSVPERDPWSQVKNAKKWNVKLAKFGKDAETTGSNGGSDFIMGLKEDVRNPKIREIVKDECDGDD